MCRVESDLRQPDVAWSLAAAAGSLTVVSLGEDAALVLRCFELAVPFAGLYAGVGLDEAASQHTSRRRDRG